MRVCMVYPGWRRQVWGYISPSPWPLPSVPGCCEQSPCLPLRPSTLTLPWPGVHSHWSGPPWTLKHGPKWTLPTSLGCLHQIVCHNEDTICQTRTAQTIVATYVAAYPAVLCISIPRGVVCPPGCSHCSPTCPFGSSKPAPRSRLGPWKPCSQSPVPVGT